MAQTAPSNRPRGIDLKAARVRAGLTQSDLAALLGVSRSRIYNVESAYQPARSIVRRILAALAALPNDDPPDTVGGTR
jgi:transcriptional regulator with XRE-family HTH domain